MPVKKKRRRKRSENENLQPFPSLSLNNDPQLEVFSVTMRCSNADLLALWLILCTQGHEGFNSPPGHRFVCALASLCVCVCLRHPCIYLCVCFFFSCTFPLYFHQITNSNESPLAIIAHFSADPTRWGGQSVLLWAFVCIKMGWVEYQNVQTQDVYCGLSGPLHCVQYSCACY